MVKVFEASCQVRQRASGASGGLSPTLIRRDRNPLNRWLGPHKSHGASGFTLRRWIQQCYHFAAETGNATPRADELRVRFASADRFHERNAGCRGKNKEKGRTTGPASKFSCAW